jgi:hypothetical protein
MDVSAWHGMECERFWRPFFFAFTFILQVESVSGVATRAKQSLFVVTIGERSFRLSVFSCVPRSHRGKRKFV